MENKKLTVLDEQEIFEKLCEVFSDVFAMRCSSKSALPAEEGSRVICPFASIASSAIRRKKKPNAVSAENRYTVAVASTII